MISVYARYHGGEVHVRGKYKTVRSVGEICEMSFFDLESAHLAFVAVGRSSAAEVEDDLGEVHRYVDTTCGFSASRREVELWPATRRAS